jgi:hypothetical protein
MFFLATETIRQEECKLREIAVAANALKIATNRFQTDKQSVKAEAEAPADLITVAEEAAAALAQNLSRQETQSRISLKTAG